MKRKLTEAQAWREIARRIAEERWGGTGLCCEVTQLLWEDRITLEQENEMRGTIKDNIGNDGIFVFGHGPWAFLPGHPDVRVLAALFLALEARDER